MTKNTKLLLALVAILVLLRFVWQPLYQNQTQSLKEKQEFQQRIDKARAVLDKKDEFEFMLVKSQSVLQQLEGNFPLYQDTSELRFEYQKKLEQLAKDHGLRITRADWRGEPEQIDESGIMKSEFVAFIRGHSIETVNFMRALNETSVNTKVTALRLNMDEYGNEPMQLAEGPVTLAVYYRVAEGEQ